jgi:hypothetical protein
MRSVVHSVRQYVHAIKGLMLTLIIYVLHDLFRPNI